jgi:hypothetical protein
MRLLKVFMTCQSCLANGADPLVHGVVALCANGVPADIALENGHPPPDLEAHGALEVLPHVQQLFLF